MADRRRTQEERAIDCALREGVMKMKREEKERRVLGQLQLG
tara:strand:- start:25 stop:147 length:123 start_codon:yes stop_codon:yes gene_type:complete